jgi:hypothetical protein
MKKIILVLSLTPFFSFGQTGMSKQKDVQEIKNRSLIVVLEEANEKLTQKLKPEELDAYKADIEGYNKNIREAVALTWKFNPKIEYMTRAEMDKLVKAKSKEYAYVEYNKFTVNCANAAAYRSTLNLKDAKSHSNGTALVGGDYIATQLNIRLSDDNPLGPPVYAVRMAGPFPDKSDLAYALKAMELQLNYKLEGKSDRDINDLFKEKGKSLPTLTLLVDEQDTELKLEEIKKAYPYPVELVKKDKIGQAILSSDAKTAFVIVIPYGNNSYSFLILSSADCAEMGRTAPEQSTGMSVGIGAMDAINDLSKSKVKKDHFKIFAKNAK